MKEKLRSVHVFKRLSCTTESAHNSPMHVEKWTACGRMTSFAAGQVEDFVHQTGNLDKNANDFEGRLQIHRCKALSAANLV